MLKGRCSYYDVDLLVRSAQKRREKEQNSFSPSGLLNANQHTQAVLFKTRSPILYKSKHIQQTCVEIRQLTLQVREVAVVVLDVLSVDARR